MSLRSRVLVVLVVVTAAVAVGVDTVTYVSLKSFLVRRVDQQLDAAHRPVIRALGGRVLRTDDLAVLAPGLYLEIRDADGDILQREALRRPDQEPMTPLLPADLPVPDAVADAGSDDAGAFRSVRAQGESPRFRVGTWRIASDGSSLVLVLPLDDLDSTLRRLLLVEVIVTGIALSVGVALARGLVKLGLRPLDDIAATAAAIAGGDLTQRVSRQEPTTEVGRLGSALNAMLGQIEGAFEERQVSEERLRRFVADASHELRTPLTSIRAYAELFERGADTRPEDLGRLLHGIEREAARMGVLVDDLLLLARLDQGRTLEGGPVDLGALAAEAIDAARAVDETRPLVLDVDGSVEVAGDRIRLRQILDNLLANVRAHTPPGTTARLSVAADHAGGSAVVAVADDGPGLTEEERARVFERFYRADPSRSRDAGGSGLGLAIVAAIAEAHGGKVAVGPSPASGASFEVRLPLLDRPPLS